MYVQDTQCVSSPLPVPSLREGKSLPSILLASCLPVFSVHWPRRGDILATRRGLVSIQQTSYLIITQVGEPET